MQLKNAKILIIDDDQDVLTALRLLLKSFVAEITIDLRGVDAQSSDSDRLNLSC